MFSNILKQYSQGKITYEDIKEALSSSLTATPEMHTNVTALLNHQQVKALLTSEQQQELLGIVYEMTQGGQSEATRISTETRINPPHQVAPQESPAAEPNSEATQLGTTRVSRPTEHESSVLKQGPDQLKPGSTIKGRFVLEEMIGQGGMGVVFKARDLRKEEAMDRNPFVAIKVLGESFKDHPQALIALQRESRKAQTLAHPNIVTVFDFDRDGDIVYMTMEYLEGAPLDKLLKQHYPKPFEKDKALSIIDGICSGLAYAHSHNIIHADLKPGNIYVTKNNTVKIFDFGIARAMKKKDGDIDVDELSGETTLFDAGDLGGLTPAYASFEMLTGEEPDVRDDIYALACIAYELLAGKHPFNKLPANQAKKRGLNPPPVNDITRKQARGLKQGLSLDRKTCSPSVTKFHSDLCGKRNLSKGLISATAVASVAALAIGSIPVMSYIDDQKISRLVAAINSGEEQKIVNTLALVSTLDQNLQEGALAGGKDAIIQYYEQKVENETDTDNNIFNFTKAEALLKDAKQLYPDSAQLEVISSRINNRKNTLLNSITNRFNQHIEDENLISKPKTDDLLDTLSEVALIDKNHPLLTDPRISIAYTQAAEAAAKSNSLRYAGQLVATGLALLPNDTSLVNMQDAIEEAKANTGDAASQLASLQRSLEKSVPPEQRQAIITDLLATPFKDRLWSATLAGQFKYLKENVGDDAPWVLEHNTIIRDLYVTQAKKMRNALRYSEASNVIRTAKTIVPSSSILLTEEMNIVTAKMEYEKEQKQKGELARIEGIKRTLLTQAAANDIRGAKDSLGKLQEHLPSNNTFITAEAPTAIANAYLRLAKTSDLRGDTASAIDLINAGLAVSPNQINLQQALKAYQTKIPVTPPQPTAPTPAATITPPVATDPCITKFAGHGKRGRATCSDVLAKNTKGPTMIVIPAGSGIEAPFAISKYEISIKDYNNYCQLSNHCSSQPNQVDLPITGISYSDAQNYSQWLSETTQYNYRIPTTKEWIHAATAEGNQPVKDFNCQVSLGGSLLKGQALLSTRSGKSNGWGLTNYIGNVQEWTLTAQNKLEARGGAYQDPLSNCDISLSRKHNGSADKITGFRLVRGLK